MKNHRFALVILDSAGRSMRRFTVTRVQLQWLAVAVICLSLAGLVGAISGLMVARSVRQSQRIAQENRQLKQLLQVMEAALPEAYAVEQHTELSFSQLWSKSGLGNQKHRLLATLDEKSSRQAKVSKTATAPVPEITIDKQQAAEFPLRIHHDGTRILSSLNELLDYSHDAKRLLSNTPSIRPAPMASMTSRFGRRRDPFHSRQVMHKGLDFAGYVGMDVYAPADGIVIWAGVRGGYGRTIVVDHGFGLQSHYAHLSRYLVRPGDRVRRGTLIAEMGNTGRSTGPHLHYEVRRNGRPLNPISFVLD